MNNFIVASAACIVVVVSILIVLRYRHNVRKTFDTLNRMIDSVLEGNFSEEIFDETKLSALESKLAHYLRASEVSARNVAEERNKIKTLVADISHQTKTPLSNLLLYSELLKESDLDGDNRKNVEAISEQAQKLRFLIDALVKLSRLETGIITVQPKLGDVQSLAQTLYSQYRSLAEQQGLYLTLCAPDVPEGCDGCRAKFDEKWTLEALENIMDNAIKYTETGGITIQVRAYEMFCCINIADTGIGIPEEEQAQIFSRFYRSQSVSQKQGVGIGLYLAREIIAAEDGYIKVRSKCGEGSTFSVYLAKE